jgi:hypothetical protein
LCELTFDPAGGLLVNFERSTVTPSRITIGIVSIKLIMSTSMCKKVQKSTYSLIYYFVFRCFFFVSPNLYIEELCNNLNLHELFSYLCQPFRQ